MDRFARWSSIALVLAAGACGGGSSSTPIDATPPPDAVMGGPQPPFPSLVCPGAPGCATAAGPLRVGAARVEITPPLADKDRGWVDEDGDHVYDSDEPYQDTNGNGRFDAVWIAGSQNARPMTGSHDPVWARALVFDQGDTRIAVVVYDLIGWFVDDIDATRAMLPASLGIDHVIVSSTHGHQGPDTMGLWGVTSLESGVDPTYNQWVRERTVAALTEAVAALEPVTMTVVAVPTVDGMGHSAPYVSDLRDPIVLDPTLTVARFAAVAAPARTVATLVHWAAHPEYIGFDNNLVSSDVVHYVRDTIEAGAPATAAGPAEPGLGGVAVYVQGAVGGQIGPWGTRPIAADGSAVDREGFARAEAAGVNVGRVGLAALASATAEDVAAPTLGFRTGEILVRVENVFYHVGALVGVFKRRLVGYDPTRAIADDNMPYVPSRVSYLSIGPLAVITAPGELHPELFVGGYDGSASYGVPIASADNPNPPRLGDAPPPPYLRDRMRAVPGVRYPLVANLAEDTLGYIVPRWNFELSAQSPYLEEADGDHYEETNSVGPTAEAEIVGAMTALIEWRP